MNEFPIGTAPLANRYLISIFPGEVIRLAFAEQLEEGAETHFRGAVALPVSEAIKFVELLSKSIENSRPKRSTKSKE